MPRDIIHRDREEWRARRRKGVGGSDIAGIFGLSNYSTPYTVWADKTGRISEQGETLLMRWGRDLEQSVAQRFTEQTGLRVRRDGRTITNPQYPYSFAHIDRRIVGQPAGVECKTASIYRRAEFTDDEYPIEYHTQALHYLAVTGWETWYIAVIIRDSGEFFLYPVNRAQHQEDIDEIQRKVTFFWESYVLADTAPPMDGLKPTTDALAEEYGETADTTINLAHMENRCIEIFARRKQIEALETEQEKYKQEIKLAMGENERADLGAWCATWKHNKKGVRVFNVKINNQ